MEGSRPERRRMLLVGGGLAAAAMAVVIMSVGIGDRSGRGGRSSELLAASPGLVFPGQAELDAVYGADAEAVLSRMGMSMSKDQPKRSVQVGCGFMGAACLAEVGKCVAPLLTEEGGSVAVADGVCNCFNRTHFKAISLPSDPSVALLCTVNCIDSVFNVFDHYVLKVNGPTGPRLPCHRSVQDMQVEEFGNAHGYLHTPEDIDASQLWPVDSVRVQRAAEALRIQVNSDRMERCPAKGLFTASTVNSAWGSLITRGHNQFLFEVSLDSPPFPSAAFHARVARTPSVGLASSHGVPNPADAANLLGEYEIFGLSPDPCGDQKLALTHKEDSSRYTLSGDFGRKAPIAGGVSMDAAARLQRLVDVNNYRWNTTGFVPPKAYDARGRSAIGRDCATAIVKDQGNCASCFAFAAATVMSYRLCLQTKGVHDYDLSAQELLDCSTGSCRSGGNTVDTMAQCVEGGKKPAISSWCDPYNPKQEECGNMCKEGMRIYSKKGGGRTMGFTNPEGLGAEELKAALRDNVKQYQMEVLEGGPVAFTIKAYDEFIRYKGGIYEVGDTKGSSVHAGGHAVALVGWGEENGMPYWLIQNSWGGRWGEGGYGRIRMGVNAGGCEDWGIDAQIMSVPTTCGQTTCENGGELLMDCSCKCKGLWKGQRCDVCPNDCGMGRHKGGGSCECECPPGASGAACQDWVTVSEYANCEGDSKVKISVKWSGPQNQGAFVAFYALGESLTFRQDPSDKGFTLTDKGYEYLCGSVKWSNANSPTACGPSGEVKISPPSAPGEYGVYLIPYIKGVGTPQPLRSNYLVSGYSVLPSAQCDAKATEVAAGRNNLQKRWAAADITAAADQLPLHHRLQGLHMEGTQDLEGAVVEGDRHLRGSLTVWGMHRDTLWLGQVHYRVCFDLFGEGQADPKHIALFESRGNGSYAYVPWGVGAVDQLGEIEKGRNGCATLVIVSMAPGGIATPPPQYKLQLFTGKPAANRSGHVEEGSILASTGSFGIARAEVLIADVPSVTAASATAGRNATLSIKWRVSPHEKADRNDVVGVFNKRREQVFWFYTSCACQTSTLGLAAVADSEGTRVTFAVEEGHPSGGYSLRFMPRGTRFVAAVDTEWINWEHEFAGGF